MAKVTKIEATLLATTAALSFAFNEQVIIPSKNYNLRPIFTSKYSWENNLEGRYFTLEYKEIFNKYEIIYQFASNIIRNSEDLEPSIVEFVNKNFWQLI